MSTSHEASQHQQASAISSIADPIPVPSYPTGGLFTILASTTIHASPSEILDVILDLDSYHKWNTFVPRATVVSTPSSSSTNNLDTRLQVGTTLTLHAYMKGPGTACNEAPVLVTIIDKLGDGRNGYRVVWKAMAFNAWLLRGERVQEMVDLGSGNTQYKTWETFGGPLAYVVRVLHKENLISRFRDCSNDLKGYVEGLEK
ncbi:hypothetical protein MMC07_001634 [Pseudocyphellaria aurata]|nr:hypothetical protein [Pseudocyphellaria aurata]